MKICVLIPTYNEAKTIGWLIRKIIDKGIKDVVIVDDGSTDSTSKIAEENGAKVLRNSKNLGKGTALRIGFSYCLKNDFDLVITMDGDGQHSPEEIPRFLRFFEETDVDLVIGNRMSSPKGMPLLRFLTNKFMSWILSLMAKQKIPDTQCGFRLIKREVLEKINLRAKNFEIESEMIIGAIRKGFIVSSFPIKTIYFHDSISQINPFVDTFRFFRFVLRTIVRW